MDTDGKKKTCKNCTNYSPYYIPATLTDPAESGWDCLSAGDEEIYELLDENFWDEDVAEKCPAYCQKPKT